MNRAFQALIICVFVHITVMERNSFASVNNTDVVLKDMVRYYDTGVGEYISILDFLIDVTNATLTKPTNFRQTLHNQASVMHKSFEMALWESDKAKDLLVEEEVDLAAKTGGLKMKKIAPLANELPIVKAEISALNKKVSKQHYTPDNTRGSQD
jgi:hypothetical protein